MSGYQWSSWVFLIKQSSLSLTAAGIPASSAHTPIIRCWRSLCQWFGSRSSGGLGSLDEETRVLGDSYVSVRNESVLRSWSPLNRSPTLVPCLHKVLLPWGRKLLESVILTRPEWLFEACASYLGFQARLQYITTADVWDHFLIERKPKRVATTFFFSEAWKCPIVSKSITTNIFFFSEWMNEWVFLLLCLAYKHAQPRWAYKTP